MNFLVRWIVAVVLMTLTGCQATNPVNATRLTVAAASDLKFALDETIGQFKKSNPATDIRPIYGSSGSFYTQIRNGAPFDMFLSADAEYPDKLRDDGFAIEGTEFEYAIGRLVVWAKRESLLEVEQKGMDVLADARVMKIAIANPEHAPYGRNAVEAMRRLGVYDRIQDRFVFGENVSQALEFVESGAAQAGVIAMSLAVAPTIQPRGKYWEIPLSAYPRMDQVGVILRTASNRQAADRFRAFILSDEGRAIFKRFGFYLP